MTSFSAFTYILILLLESVSEPECKFNAESLNLKEPAVLRDQVA